MEFRYRVRARMAADLFHAAHDQPPKRILDLGCAEGATLLELRTLLHANDSECVGLEGSSDLLSRAPALPPGVRLVSGDAQAPPDTIDGPFELVTALAVLEHLPRPEDCVSHAFRLLGPDGLFVATCPDPLWDHIASKMGLVGDDQHEQHLGLSELHGLLENAGFVDITHGRFMCAPVGIIPYLRIPVSPRWAARLDRVASKVPGSGLLFVNQWVTGKKCQIHKR